MSATFHDLKGKSVYITGGGSGIGAALTDGFLAQGANVAFIGRSDASAFVDEMAAKHGRAPLFLQGDITDVPHLQDTMAQAAEAFGPIDVLVSNAANDKRHSWDSLTVDDWDWLQNVNLRPYFFAAQTAARGMQAKGAGSGTGLGADPQTAGGSCHPRRAGRPSGTPVSEDTSGAAGYRGRGAVSGL